MYNVIFTWKTNTLILKFIFYFNTWIYTNITFCPLMKKARIYFPYNLKILCYVSKKIRVSNKRSI